MDTLNLVIVAVVNFGPMNKYMVTKYANNYWDLTDMVTMSAEKKRGWSRITSAAAFKKAVEKAKRYVREQLIISAADPGNKKQRRIIHDAIYGAMVKACGLDDHEGLAAHIADEKYLVGDPIEQPQPSQEIVVATPPAPPAYVKTYEYMGVSVEVNTETQMLNATKFAKDHNKTIQFIMNWINTRHSLQNAYKYEHGKPYTDGTTQDLMNMYIHTDGDVTWISCKLLVDVMLCCNDGYYWMAVNILKMYHDDKIGLAANLVQEHAKENNVFSTMQIITTDNKEEHDARLKLLTRQLEVEREQRLMIAAENRSLVAKSEMIVAKATGQLWEAQHLVEIRKGDSLEATFEAAVAAVTARLGVLKKIETLLPKTLQVASDIGYDAMEQIAEQRHDIMSWKIDSAEQRRAQMAMTLERKEADLQDADHECEQLKAVNTSLLSELEELRLSGGGYDDEDIWSSVDAAPPAKAAARRRKPAPAVPREDPPAMPNGLFTFYDADIPIANPPRAGGNYQIPSREESPFLPMFSEYDVESHHQYRDEQKRSARQAHDRATALGVEYCVEIGHHFAVDSLRPDAKARKESAEYPCIYMYACTPVYENPFSYVALLAADADHREAERARWRLRGFINMRPGKLPSKYLDEFMRAQYALQLNDRVYAEIVAHGEQFVIWRINGVSRVEEAWMSQFGEHVISRTNPGGAHYYRGQWLL